jgi:hypothetical protein
MSSSKPDPNQQHKPRWVERRSGVDRRRVDVSQPDKRERRRGVESRKPDVVELEMSNSEWSALMGLPTGSPTRS